MANTPDHLTPIFSERGFRQFPAITDAYGGTIRVYESSAAESPHLWLNVTAFAGFTDKGTAHLTIDQARQIADQLNWFADHHYQNDGE